MDYVAASENEACISGSKMATAGTVLTDFMSQNSIILIVAVLATAAVVALSTYYMVRSYASSNAADTVAISDENGEGTARNFAADNRSSASNSKTTDGSEKGDEDGVGESGDCTTGEPASSIDPVYYCEHIQGEIKKVKQDVTTRKICEGLSPEQIAEERQRQQEQLAEIFKLMQERQEQFGISSMDEMQAQMRLYANI